jgi:hypothetical protein
MNVLDDPAMQNCLKCEAHATQLFSLTVMRPDSHWNGVYFETTDYYSTSKAKYDRWCKHHWENDFERSFIEVGDRTDKEGLAKDRESAGRSKDRRHEKELERFLIQEYDEKELERFLIQEYAGVDIEQDNCTSVKEKRKKEQKRKEMESACPDDIFIDPAFT